MKRWIWILALCLALLPGTGAVAQDGPVIDAVAAAKMLNEMRAKLDGLQNVVVDYQLHNKHKNEIHDIKLTIKDLRTFRLETGGVVYIVNNGDMIFFNAVEGRRSNMRKVQEEYAEETKSFWTDHGQALKDVLGTEAEGMITAMRQNLSYPMMELRVNRARDYRPDTPTFTFTAKAALATTESYYSWIYDMRDLCTLPDVALQVYPNYLAVKTPQVEFWVAKDTGLLHTQKILMGKNVEASLTATNITQMQTLDPALFKVEAPEGCKVEEVNQLQISQMFMDMQATFARHYGRALDKLNVGSWDEARKAAAADLFAAWLDCNFEMYMSKDGREKEITEKMAVFREGMDTVADSMKDTPEKIPGELNQVKISALQVVKRRRDEFHSNINTPLLTTIKDSLKSTTSLDGEKWREPFRVMQSGLNKSYKKNFETEFFDILENSIRAATEEKIKSLQ